MKREQWETGYVAAYIWGCGDDCNCIEPRIDRIEPNHQMGFPFIRRTVLWVGTFHADAWYDSAYEEAVAELAEAKKDYPEAVDV